MADPVIHHDFIDGTNKGTGGSAHDLQNTGSLTFDTTNKVSGTSSVSVTGASANAGDCPQFPFNTGVNGLHTMCFWMRFTAETSVLRYLFTTTTSAADKQHLNSDTLRTFVTGSYNSTANIRFGTWSALNNTNFLETNVSPPYNDFSTTGYCDGNWHHFVMVSNNSGAANSYDLYLDNVLAATNMGVNSSNGADRFMFLGGSAWSGSSLGNNQGITGNVDDFRLYDYVLDSTAISGLYISGLISSGSSVAELLALGLNLADLIAGGVTIAELIGNYTYAQLRAAGVSITAFIDEGVSNANMLAAGFTQVDIDIALTNIKIHTAFTISDGTNSSVFATTDAVYTPTTFAAKLTTDLGYTVTAGGDLTTTDSTPYYRIYLQFANAVTLTNMPKDIFNIPFSNFSVKAGGQVNLRNVNLDAPMTINTSYEKTYTFGQVSDPIIGANAGDGLGSCSMSADGTIIAVGEYGYDSNKGRAAMYKYSGGSWVKMGAYIDGTVAGGIFGYAISLSEDGSIVVIGGANSNSNIGLIRTFQYSTPGIIGGSWTQIGENIDGDNADDYFGYNVAISNDGSIVAAGAYKAKLGGTTTNGTVKIYQYKIPTGTEWTSGNVIKGTDTNQVAGKLYWTQLGTDINGDHNGEMSGFVVSLNGNGNIVSIGSPYYSGDNGRIRVFQYIEGSWSPLGGNISSNTGGRSSYTSLSDDGKFCAVGTLRHSGDSGMVQVYEYSTPGTVGGVWNKIGGDMVADSVARMSEVAINGDGTLLVVGGYYSNNYTGAINIWQYDGSSWTRIKSMAGPNAGSRFGISTAISRDGSLVIVGANGYDVAGTEGQGAVYVYQVPVTLPKINTSTIPAGNNFINNFVNTLDTDLAGLTLLTNTFDYTLSYDETNNHIEFVGLAQDISMSITSTDTTIFDTSITEITTTANTLPFLTYGQPDPTIKDYSDNGITTGEFVSNGYTIPQLYKEGVIPDWTFDTDANHFDQSYVKDFIDISGSLALRENASLTVNGNIETKGNITIKNPIMEADLSLNHNMVVVGDISMNGNVTVGDVSMNGYVVDCSFTFDSIPENAFIGTIPSPDYAQPTIVYEKGFDTTADVSMNGNVQISKLKVDGNIEFSDGTTMNTYDNNIDYMNINQQYSILNKPVINIPYNFTTNTVGSNHPSFGTIKISSDGSIVVVQIGTSFPNLTSSSVNYNYAGFGLLISRDSGATWNLTKMPDASDGHVTKDNNHHGLNMSIDGKHMTCITGRILNKPDNNQYVWFSHDYGVTWTQGIISPTTHASRILLNACISDDGVHIYVTSYEENVVHQSHDSGSTWTSVAASGRSSASGTMLCTSTGQKVIYSTNASSLGISTNYGESFQSLTLGGNSVAIVANADFTRMLVNTNGWNRVWICDGDFADINNWTEYNQTFDLTGNYRPRRGMVASPNCKHIMIHTETSTNKRTVSDDYGVTWSNVDLPDPGTNSYYSMAISDTGKFFYLDSGLQHINMINLPPFKDSTFTSLDISGNLTAGSFSTSSDYRIKTDISKLDETVTLDNLRPVKYLQTLINKPQYGLIAHELQEYYPDLVVGEKDGEEWQRVNYTGLIALLINEIKQLKRELNELENSM